MNHTPFFSIVVPCYNRADLLPRTIASIQKQTCSDYELLIVDDGSKDHTKEVIDSLLKGNNHIRYIYQDNAERGAARNNGIRNAKGIYVLFFDSDDEMKEDYLMVLQEGIRLNPGYNFYSAKYNMVEDGNELASSISSFRQGGYGLETVLKGNPFACNFCIKRDQPSLKLFIEDRTLATTEDWMFLVQNLYKEKIFVIDFVGLNMHQHDGRSMQQNQMLIDRRIRATKLLCEQMPLDEVQSNLLWAYSYYFCSIHAYLDVNKEQSLKFIKKAATLSGWNKDFLKAYLKYIVGRKAIMRLTSLLK